MERAGEVCATVLLDLDGDAKEISVGACELVERIRRRAAPEKALAPKRVVGVGERADELVSCGVIELDCH
ncbi:hypothetical protein JD292_09000 [Leucobacter sp. CSA2]|uniref:Uncharacterized protein n=1 Tax=Leucobacter edaphi TaxID=2796472 RepID=A0A934UY07_9MICO|nr:hypothetical protein [Leucobacter edaphi]MBK0422211.1 hypothetical protein [Leucobacter edaphi]